MGSSFSARPLSFPGGGASHTVRGLVVRCLLFNPEVSCSNPSVCAYFFASRVASSSMYQPRFLVNDTECVL